MKGRQRAFLPDASTAFADKTAQARAVEPPFTTFAVTSSDTRLYLRRVATMTSATRGKTMRIANVLATFALTSLTVIACGASPEASEGTSAQSEALTGSGGTCMTDSACKSGLVCDLICPVLPNRAHCDIAGGTCEPVCSLAASNLEGNVYTSADGVESVTFTSAKAFSKSVGCPKTGGITCDHVVVSNGTYVSYGTSIVLTTTTGVKDTLTVEPHCYDGLYDVTQKEELYFAGTVPVACGPSIGASCPAGSYCEGLPLPSSGLIGGSGTCGSATLCNPNTSLACGSSLDCVGTDLKHYGACEAFAAGETVGKGYKCGGSIGVSCITGLTCTGLPTGVVGGTGTCE